ncbi:snRNA-activating complex subunit 1 [Brachionus plicatilis]|uniref:snRNA-activating complex subunit 1 n=1 Tax=Brachionus plicatilis TaxID=10195 RepID=A0A3M7RW62_BRAPC|nr:snRNA-activating complex subunit 1 [Brachionus plicatilis]
MQNSSESEKDFNHFFRQDILKLLNNFYQLKSFRFEQFLTIWNEMKFYQLFCIPRFFPFDYRYYMKDLLKIGSEYLYDEELYPEVRTGALYVIYAIYFNQSNRPRTKVPVSTEQWIQILKFVDFLNQAEHVDAEYVFRHLLHSDAFEFCSFF